MQTRLIYIYKAMITKHKTSYMGNLYMYYIYIKYMIKNYQSTVSWNPSKWSTPLLLLTALI